MAETESTRVISGDATQDAQQAAAKLDIAVRVVDRREGDHRGESLLSAWEGFGRFARKCCGAEPLALVMAWRLLDGDPAAEVRKLYPKGKAVEAVAAGWHASLAGPWKKYAEAR